MNQTNRCYKQNVINKIKEKNMSDMIEIKVEDFCYLVKWIIHFSLGSGLISNKELELLEQHLDKFEKDDLGEIEDNLNNAIKDGKIIDLDGLQIVINILKRMEI